MYTRSSFIAQIFVYGDSFQSCLVAVVVPDADYVKTWGVEHGVDGKDMAAACASPALRDAIMADMKVIAKAGASSVIAVHVWLYRCVRADLPVLCGRQTARL